eukprot:90339_1
MASEGKVRDHEYRNNYIAVYDHNTLSYEAFVRAHLLKNQPCIIKNIVHNNNHKQWLIYDKWLNHSPKSGNTTINHKHLIHKYGVSKVDVAYCGNQSYSDQKRTSMSLSDYLKHLQSDNEQKENKLNHDLHTWIHNIKEYKLTTFDPQWTSNILYCKDWHIMCDSQTDSKLYETPLVFCDDWLNYYWDTKGTNDYKFCYLGPLGSWTPLHHDVYSSYSWSTNVLGQKLWILFSPSESKYYLKNKKRNEWIYNVLSLVDHPNIDNEYKPSEYPNVKHLLDTNNQILCKRMVIQKENEAIFIPSMWFHEVYNLSEVVLSINHNWLNGFNIHWIWNCIYNEYQRVVESLDDLKDILDTNAFYDKCQELLMDFLGINFGQFLEIIALNTESMLRILTDNDTVQNVNNFKIKTYLFSMKHVVNTIQQCVQSKCMNKKHTKQFTDIQSKIEQTLSKLNHICIDDSIWCVSD